MSTEVAGTEVQKDLIVVKPKPSPITAWAERGEVRELAERLQMMMPGAQKLTKPESLALAQAAVAHGLDPFNGELWYIPGSGLMAGIKGHRRAGHRQMEQEGGGNYWPEFDELDIDEKGRLGIPVEALAYRCKVRDTRTINHYVEQIERLLKADLPWEVVSDIVGSRPYTEGVGFAQKSEKSRMTLVQRAMKRAEADALKRRFDLPFASIIGTGRGDEGDVYEGEFYVEEPQLSQETMEKAQADLDANRDLLRGTEDEREWDTDTFDAAEGKTSAKVERPADAPTVRGWLRERGKWTKEDADDWSNARRQPDDEQEPPSDALVQRIAALMGKALTGGTDLERHSVLIYAFGVSSTKLLTLMECNSLAKWLEASPMGYIPSGVAAEECRLMLREALKDAGQQELPLEAD